MHIKDLLLDADYISVGSEENKKAVIRLFLRENIIYDASSVPYFYALLEENLSEDEKAKVLEKLRELGEIEKVAKKLLGKEIEIFRISVSHPGEVPKKREAARSMEGVEEIFEHDILFARRYLIDRHLLPTTFVEADVEEIEGKRYVRSIKSTQETTHDLKMLSFDLEVYNPKMAPREKEDPIVMVSLASNRGLRKVLAWKEVKGLSFVEVHENEAEILKRFEEIVKEEDPDILIGYNSDNFDLPYIDARAKVLELELKLGRADEGIRIRSSRGIVECEIPGRVHIDLYPIIRRSVKLSSYVLEDVVRSIFGREKVKIKGADMAAFWEKGGEELKAFANYAMEDADAALELAGRFVPLYYELSQVVGIPLFDIARMTSGQLVEWLLIREAYSANELVPTRVGGSEYLRRAEDTYVGGYVLEPKKALAENIAVFDFRSLYPSIIITHNIDPATIRAGKNSNAPPDLDVHFSKENEGFIPGVVKKIVQKRIEAKEAIKKEKNENKKKMLELKQQALKLLANSFYGYMGYPRARWYKKACAESVTSFARSYIKSVMQAAEQEFNFEVVYGDTDSLFVVLKEGEERKDAVGQKERIKKFLDEMNKRLPGIIELEYQGFYKRGVFLTKKRYALMDENREIIVKGLELVRRDWAEIAKATQKEVLKAILEEGNPEKAAQIVKDKIVRIRNRNVKLDEIALYTQITRSLNAYKNVGPHVKAARKAKEKGREIFPGMIISYVIVKGKGMISDRAVPIEDVKLEDYDVDYYLENQLLPPVVRILEALGYSQESLKGEKRQLGLEGWF